MRINRRAVAAAALSLACIGSALTPVMPSRVVGALGAQDCAAAPAPFVNLSGCDLSGLNLRSAVLSHADLTGANLSSVDLVGAQLGYAVLTGANLSGADLSGADLARVISGGILGQPAGLPTGWRLVNGYLIGSYANLSGADLAGIDLAGADLSGASLGFANLAGTDLSGVARMDAVISFGITGTPSGLPSGWGLVNGYLAGPSSNLGDANLVNGNLAGLNLHASFLARARLAGANLSGADLSNVNMANADLAGAIVTGTNLTGADLANAVLTGVVSGGIVGQPTALPAGWALVNGTLAEVVSQCADAPAPGINWSGCDLSGRNLIRADLTGANLSGANLTGAYLGYSTLSGANLSAANLTSAYLGGSKLPNADLSGAVLTNANISSGVLSNANLTNANLSGAGLQYAVMSGAVVSGADFSGAALVQLRSGGLTGQPAALPTDWHLVGGYLVGPNADLTDADLSTLDLSNLNLSYSIFTGSNLAGTTLTGTDLSRVRSGAVLGQPAALPSGWSLVGGYLIGFQANLTGADFANVDLSNVDMYFATLTQANLTGANLTGVHLANVVSGGIVGVPAALPTGWRMVNGYLVGRDANLVGARLAGANLSGADLSRVFLGSADLVGANLSGADLSYATMNNLNLSNVNAANANFFGTSLNNSNLASSDLSGASLFYTYLNNTNLATTTLTGVVSGGISGTPAALPSGWTLVNGVLVPPAASSVSRCESLPAPGLDFSGCDLVGRNWAGVNLTGANLSNTNLADGDLSGANLSGANLSGSNLVDELLIGTNLSDSNLSGADLRALLDDANLSGSNATGVNLTGVNLARVNLSGTNLVGATLTLVMSSGIVGQPAALPTGFRVLAGAIVGPGTIVQGDFADTDFTGVDLSFASLIGSNLDGANLNSVNMYRLFSDGNYGQPSALPSGTRLVSGHLVGPGVDLTNRDLSNTDLSNLDLAGADLSGASLAFASIAGANLTGANLNGAVLEGVFSDQVGGQPSGLPAGYSLVDGFLFGPGVDLNNRDLTNLNVANLDLSRANLVGAGLSGSNLSGTNLKLANLFGATLGGAILTDANLDGANLENSLLVGVVSGGILGTPASLPTGWVLFNGTLRERINVVVTARSPTPISDTAGLPLIGYSTSPATTPSDWATEPTCAVYAQSDVGYLSPLDVPQPPGIYVTHCHGGVSLLYNPGLYEDGSLRIFTVPGSPSDVLGMPGNRLVDLQWVAPVSDGGAPVSDYVIEQSSDGGVSWSLASDSVSSAVSATVTGLTNGVSYVFRVSAVNVAGTGAASAATATAIRPRTVPVAAGLPAGVATSGQVALSWPAPISDGGAPVLDYIIEFSTDGGVSWTTVQDGASPQTGTTLTGLTNGVGYVFRVSAVNVAGTGAPSVSSAVVTPRGAPSQPGMPAVTPGNLQVSLVWSAPSSNGGSAVTDYLVQFSANGGVTWSTFADGLSTATASTVTGLVNGTNYVFRVAAVNALGTSVFSAVTAAVAPRTTPGAPGTPAGVAGNAQVSLSWAAPTTNGGAPVLDYFVERSVGRLGPWTRVNDGVSSTTSTVVTGLVNGTAYNFRVAAVNAAGAGGFSTVSAAIRPVGPPSAPAAPTGTAGNQQVALTWGTPANGGSAITDYRIEYSVDGVTWTLFVDPVSTLTNTTVRGLTNGISYRFRITAVNAIGASAPGASSAGVTPFTVPGAPSRPTGVSGSRQVTLSWTAPADTGGGTVSDYRVQFSSNNGRTWSTFVHPASAASTQVVTGLVNGTSYVFRVAAITQFGAGAVSATSLAVVPR